MKKLLTLCIVLLCIANHSAAQIPNVIPYQGQITDTGGVGYNGNFAFSFKILDNGGSALWSSSTVNLDVFKGTYSVNLGQSPQPALPNALVQNNLMFLEISFNDGVNGLETLSPNVQILPVPYALRAILADSAVNSNGQLAWGDSLVLRDASGDVRFVINPNTGEFRAMQKDTAWYKIVVNSPPKVVRKQNDGQFTEENVEMNGKSYSKLIYESEGYRAENFIQHTRDFGNTDTMEITRVYGPNDCLRSEKFLVYVVSRGTTKEVTITYNCPAGTVKGIKQEAIEGPDEEGDETEDKKTFTKTTKKTTEGRLQAATVDTRTGNLVAAIFSPKDSCFIINADKFILANDSTKYIIRLNGDGTISTEAIKINGTLPILPLLEQMDPFGQVILEQGMNEKRYKYLPDELVKIYEQAGLPDFIIEIFNNDARRYVTNGINTIQRLVDSVMIYKVKSKSVLDSITILYDAIGHHITYENVEDLDQLYNNIHYIRSLKTDGKVVETFKNTTSGNEISETKDLANKKDIMTGADGNDFIYPGADFTTTHQKSGETKQVKKITNAGQSSQRTKGLKLDINQIIGNDTFFKVIEWFDAGIVKNSTKIGFVPRDSLIIYDGNDRVVRRAGPEGNRETHVYDATSHVIEEINTPIDSTRRIIGVGTFEYDGNDNVVRRNDNGQFETKYDFDGAPNTIREISSPKDSSKVFVDVRQIRFQGTQDVRFVYEGASNTSFVAHNPDNKLVLVGGIKTAEWDFDSAIAGLYNDGTRTGLNFSNPRTNNRVGFGFDPDGKFVLLEGNGPATFATDTIIAQDMVFSNTLAVNGNGQFGGNVNVAGNISKGGGSFKIDHPQDPYNKYLYHSFVESPDMMNVYNGTTTTDTLGYDTVVMPDYFKSLNSDFRYQLTCIGTFAQAIIIKEIENNQFVIQTNKPNVKVSWQVTGIRKDNYANENRIKVEVEKKGNEKGTLLYPPKVTN